MIADNHINMILVEELKNLMKEKFPFLINTYFSDSELRLNALQKAFEGREAKEMCRAAHSFKGSSANLGAVGLVELLRKIEDSSEEEKFEESGHLLLEVQREYHYIKAVMIQWILP